MIPLSVQTVALIATIGFGINSPAQVKCLVRKLPPVAALPIAKPPTFALQVSLRCFFDAKSGPAISSATAEGESSEHRDKVARLVMVHSESGRLQDSGGMQMTSSTQDSEVPGILSWLKGWRMEKEHGLFRPLRKQSSHLAVAYSDIFESGGNPEKGGHGLALLFRKDFARSR